MAQILIPTGCDEIYQVDALSGRYDRTEGFACDFCSWKDYPKYFTDYAEARQHYDAIELDNSEGPQKKTITTISLVDSDYDENEETD